MKKRIHYDVVYYNNQKLIIYRDALDILEEFIITEFIPNEVIYDTSGSYIPYERITSITKSESTWFIGKIIRIIENNNITILDKGNMKAVGEEPQGYKISPKKITSKQMQEKIIEYKTTDDKTIKNKLKEEILLALVPYIRYKINLFSSIYTDTEVVEDICYEFVLKAIDHYDYHTKVLFKTYILKVINNCITTYYIDKNSISGYIILATNTFLRKKNITLKELFEDQYLLEKLKDIIIKKMQNYIKSTRSEKYKEDDFSKLITKKLNMLYIESLDEIEVYQDKDMNEEILKPNAQSLLEKRLAILSPHELEIITKYYYEGTATTKIAEFFGVTTQAIDKSIKKSLKRLAGLPYYIKLPLNEEVTSMLDNQTLATVYEMYMDLSNTKGSTNLNHKVYKKIPD